MQLHIEDLDIEDLDIEDLDIEDIEDVRVPVPMVDYLDSFCVCLEKRFQATHTKNNVELLQTNDCLWNILLRLKELVHVSFIRYVLRRRVNVIYRRELACGQALAEERNLHHKEYCQYFLED